MISCIICRGAGYFVFGVNLAGTGDNMECGARGQRVVNFYLEKRQGPLVIYPTRRRKSKRTKEKPQAVIFFPSTEKECQLSVLHKKKGLISDTQR